MKVLIKVGGTLLDTPDGRKNIAEQLADISKECELVTVHGGGKQVTQYLADRGVSSRFVGGLRVSDEAVIDAVTKVIAGGVNKQLVSAINAAGQSAVGISGVDGPLTSAAQLNPDLGFVGKPIHSDGRLLDLLVNAGYLPVVACIAGGDHGAIFNVNADQMAVSCAIGWGADKLFFLTDVPGVKGSDGEVIPHLRPIEAAHLINTGVAQGGMQAKLEAATLAIYSGVQEVVVAPGGEPNICRKLLTGEQAGTRLTLQAESVEARRV